MMTTNRSRRSLLRAVAARSPLRSALIAGVALVVLAAVLWLVAPRWAAGRAARERSALNTLLETTAEPAADPQGADDAPADPASGPRREAARWLIDGTRALSITPDEAERLTDLSHRNPDDWTLAERDLVIALARREAEPLAMIERAGAVDAQPFAAEDEEGILTLAIPILRGAHLLLARAGLALETAPEEAGRSLAALAGNARALQQDRRPVAQQLGTSLEELFLHGVRWAVADPHVPPEVLADLREALPARRAEDRIRTLVVGLVPTGPVKATGWRRLVPGGDALATATTLGALREIVEASRRPGRLATLAEPGGSVLSTLEVPNILDTMIRAQAVEASETLARIALTERSAASAAAPATDRDRLRQRLEELPPDLFSGGRPRIEDGPRGSFRLVNPAAVDAWTARWGRAPSGQRPPPPFTWTVPATGPEHGT